MIECGVSGNSKQQPRQEPMQERSMSKETELKPCPFCGGKAELTKHGVFCTNAGNIENCCNVCNVFLVYPARATARTQKEIEDDIKNRSIKAWNRRCSPKPRENKDPGFTTGAGG